MSFADTSNVVGVVPSGNANSFNGNPINPVKTGAVYNATPPSVTTGEVIDAQADVNGNLKVSVVNGAQTGTPGAPTTAVVTVQGVTGGTPIPVAQGLTTSGGASYNNAVAPANPALNIVKASAGNIYSILAFNATGNEVYLKFFDLASVTLGTTACSFQFMIPGNTAGAGVVIPFPQPRSCANRIAYAVTNNIAVADDTAITASSIVVDVSYN